MQFLTREFFDTLILAVILLGLALAAIRLYRDLTRPLPGSRPPDAAGRVGLPLDDDTRPHEAVREDEGQ